MRLRTQRTKSNDGAEAMALDWELLGRLVRRRTLEAVAMHCVAMATTPAWHSHAGEGGRRDERPDRKHGGDSLLRWATLGHGIRPDPRLMDGESDGERDAD